MIPYASGEKKGTIAVTLTAIEPGAKEDLAKFGDKAKNVTPFCLRVHIENLSGTDRRADSNRRIAEPEPRINHLRGDQVNERTEMKVLTRALTAVSLAGIVAITAAPAASAAVVYNKRYTSERLCHANARQIALQGATILVNCRYEGATHGSTPMWLLSYHY